MRISDWSSDVCSSDLLLDPRDSRAGLVLVDELAHPARPALGQFLPADHLQGIVKAVDQGQRGRDAKVGGLGVAEALDLAHQAANAAGDRKSTRLNSSH